MKKALARTKRTGISGISRRELPFTHFEGWSQFYIVEGCQSGAAQSSVVGRPPSVARSSVVRRPSSVVGFEYAGPAVREGA